MKMRTRIRKKSRSTSRSRRRILGGDQRERGEKHMKGKSLSFYRGDDIYGYESRVD